MSDRPRPALRHRAQHLDHSRRREWELEDALVHTLGELDILADDVRVLAAEADPARRAQLLAALAKRLEQEAR